ncbi:hypothetical protein acdb102_41560 [Acidothermaceae bacterium B102]|nr:hypothetical protein acdb102_41560 [Acidothermaceae bacterium B102]
MATHDELHQQLEALRAELQEMRSTLAPAAPRTSVLSRRTLLRAAPVAAVGTAIAALSAGPAAAAVGNPVLLGENNTATGATTSIAGGSDSAVAVLVTGGLTTDSLTSGISDDDGLEVNSTGSGPVLRAHSVENRLAAEFIAITPPANAASGHDAVHVWAQAPGKGVIVEVVDKILYNLDPQSVPILLTGEGLVVSAESGTGVDATVTDGTGVSTTATGNGHALAAVSTSATTSSDAVTIDYAGTSRALYAQSHNAANINGTVTGVNEGHGIGVWGEQRNTTGAGFGVVGVGGTLGRGARFSGGAAAAQMLPSTAATHPTTGKAGDFFVDSVVRLWFCQKASTASTAAVWKQLA